MAISYEEALETLQAMFSEPWTRQSLDAVLRHEKGHMENTCELILQHGEKDPQILVERLESGHTTNRENNISTSNSNNNNQQVGGSGHSKIGRGISTTLPEVFLRLPGYQPPPSSMLLSGPGQQQQQQQQQPMDDETLARMLQDELFSEELARNPDFAHLAGGHGQQRRTRYNSGRRSTTGGASNARLPAAQAGPPLQNPFEGVNVMQKISSMGDGARRRLQLFANGFEARMKNMNNNSNNECATGQSGLQEASGAAAERRGLLDDNFGNEDMIEFETRKKSD